MQHHNEGRPRRLVVRDCAQKRVVDHTVRMQAVYDRIATAKDYYLEPNAYCRMSVR